MKQICETTALTLVGVLAFGGLLATADEPSFLDNTPSLPNFEKVRWQTFEDSVGYLLVDSKGHPWFQMSQAGQSGRQWVCSAFAGKSIPTSPEWRTLGTDRANRMWIATHYELVCYDLDKLTSHKHRFPGLFAVGADVGWAGNRPGQVYLGHSAGRVYVHDVAGVHSFDGKMWRFQTWPEHVIGKSALKANLEVVCDRPVKMGDATFHWVEMPDGLAITWGEEDLLKGFWTHDGKNWRHHSSVTSPGLAKLTAIAPIGKKHVLICTEDADAFVYDLDNPSSVMGVPPTADILDLIKQLDAKDTVTSDSARQALREIDRADHAKLADTIAMLADEKQRDRVKTALGASAGAASQPTSMPAGPGVSLRGAKVIGQSAKGGTVLVWQEENRDAGTNVTSQPVRGGHIKDPYHSVLGILRPDGKLVKAPVGLLPEWVRAYDEVVMPLPDGDILIYCGGLWLWNKEKFRKLDDMSNDGKLLGRDADGRIYLEIINDSGFVRVVFNERYKGSAGRPLIQIIKPKIIINHEDEEDAFPPAPQR